jgi:hypothetical protein
LPVRMRTLDRCAFGAGAAGRSSMGTTTIAKKLVFVRQTPAFAAESKPLPGEDKVRSDLVNQAVSDINRIYVGKGLEAARGIGEYVLRTFFAGDVESFRCRERKHASFRELAERKDLRVSHVFLWNCVAVAEQLKALPNDIANALPVSHHKLLLPVHDEKTKVTLARKAVRENLTTKELAVEIRRVRRHATNGGKKRGRPPLPAVIRLLNSLGRLGVLAASKEVGTCDLDELPAEKVRTIIIDAERYLAAMHALVERMRRRLDNDAAAETGHGSL